MKTHSFTLERTYTNHPDTFAGMKFRQAERHSAEAKAWDFFWSVWEQYSSNPGLSRTTVITSKDYRKFRWIIFKKKNVTKGAFSELYDTGEVVAEIIVSVL